MAKASHDLDAPADSGLRSMRKSSNVGLGELIPCPPIAERFLAARSSAAERWKTRASPKREGGAPRRPNIWDSQRSSLPEDASKPSFVWRSPRPDRSRECQLQKTRNEEDKCLKGLILGGGGDIPSGQGGQKPFQFMFTWHTQWQPFEEVATSPEPGAASAPGGVCKMLADFRRSPHRLVSVHLTIVMHEQPVVASL